MHSLEILLLNRFNLDWVHVGSAHRFTDRFGIIGVVLVALDTFLLLLIKGFTNCGGIIFTG
jgi:hypothetical protein